MNSTFFQTLLILLAASPLLLSTIGSMRQQGLMKKQVEQRKNYLDSLAIGDHILLVSGIHGKIRAIDDNLVTLQIADKVTIYVEKESIMGKTKTTIW